MNDNDNEHMCYYKDCICGLLFSAAIHVAVQPPKGWFLKECGLCFQSGGKCLQENLKRVKEVDTISQLADNHLRSCCVQPVNGIGLLQHNKKLN